MPKIPTALRRLVIQRAENRCEYCLISQIGQVATFPIDHIIPTVAGGKTVIGRATLQALDLNRPTMLAIRSEEKSLGVVIHHHRPFAIALRKLNQGNLSILSPFVSSML